MAIYAQIFASIMKSRKLDCPCRKVLIYRFACQAQQLSLGFMLMLTWGYVCCSAESISQSVERLSEGKDLFILLEFVFYFARNILYRISSAQ